jgi:hypothetical protein
MNSTVSYINENEYHTFTNVEFTGVFVKSELCFWNNVTNRLDRTKQTYFTDYHLFIKYGDKVYIDVSNVGDIVISYDELQKNKYFKHYYDLSLLIADNKNTIIKKTKYKNDDPFLYNEDRFWGIDCAFLDGTYKNDETLDIVYKIANNQELYYYKINPYDLENMEYSLQEKMSSFHSKYMDKNNDNFWGILLKETYIIYNNLIKSNINESNNAAITDAVVDTVETNSNSVITDTVVDTVETNSNAAITDTVVDTVETNSNAAITDTVVDTVDTVDTVETNSNSAITDTVVDAVETNSNAAITDAATDAGVETNSNAAITDTVVDAVETNSNAAITDTVVDALETNSNSAITDVVVDALETNSNSAITDVVVDTVDTIVTNSNSVINN